jgi:hypothetical protein
MRRPILILALALLVTTVAPLGAATVIDSFTAPFPANPRLPVSGQAILFLGSTCDGAACPPGAMVTNPDFYDCVDQPALAGVMGGYRSQCLATHFAADPPHDQAVARIDPSAGGRVVVGSRGTTRIELDLLYGDNAHPLNLTLGADGSDRIEIEILGAPAGIEDVTGHVELGSHDANGFIDNFSIAEFTASGAGVVSVPYSAFDNLPQFVTDVDYIQLNVEIGGDPAIDFVLGELRTAGTPTPAAAATWGRIKNAYRR